MSEMKQNHPNRDWGRLVLFVFFLILLALVLKGMGWSIGVLAEAGTDILLP